MIPKTVIYFAIAPDPGIHARGGNAYNTFNAIVYVFGRGTPYISCQRYSTPGLLESSLNYLFAILVDQTSYKHPPINNNWLE
jgi:hypothetical protein